MATKSKRKITPQPAPEQPRPNPKLSCNQSKTQASANSFRIPARHPSLSSMLASKCRFSLDNLAQNMGHAMKPSSYLRLSQWCINGALPERPPKWDAPPMPARVASERILCAIVERFPASRQTDASDDYAAKKNAPHESFVWGAFTIAKILKSAARVQVAHIPRQMCC